jgi:P4 family phage/plasmid primase-like protien
MSTMSVKRGLVNYLNKMKSVKNSSFTHTSITEPAGSFYIQCENAQDFFRMYTEAVDAGCDLFLTEKHKDYSPVLIDLDFRFPKDAVGRQYQYDFVEEMMEIYLEEMMKYVHTAEPFEIFLMEKTSPGMAKNNELVKDGVHIVISNAVTRPSVQYILRTNTLPKLKPLFDRIGCVNRPEDVFDEAVIFKNNWQMYGSKKPGCEPYRVTKHWRVALENERFRFEECDLLPKHSDYVETLSIRNKGRESDLREDRMEEIEALDNKIWNESVKKETKKRLDQNIIQAREATFEPNCEELDLVRKMIPILSKKRADNYCDWMRLGWCLRNIHIDLLKEWDEFSMASSKYEPGECERRWYHMKEGGLGIGTLHLWAKDDNPEEYAKIMSNNISSYINKSLSDTDYDIAMVISRMFRHRFRCASTKHHTWYEFKNHRWREIERGYTLFYKLIPTVLFDEYMKAIQKETQRALRTEDDREKEMISNNIQILNKIQRKFKSTNFVKDKMYKECSGLFYEPNFEDKLDSNPTLLGFENGVYDMETNEFREGRPDDYVSFSTGINYLEYDPDNPFVEQVNDFMSKVLTHKEVREYVFTLFASMLDGRNRDENFHVWTGSGSNGKSKLVELFQQTIGDYACIFNVSMLTQKRVKSSETNSELAIAKGRRFVILQEPDENEKMQVGLMKEMTGGDKLQCRRLYREPITFKPMFTMVLTCNHMPAMPSDDGGTWRRVRRVEFTSKFTESPSMNNPREFKIDRELSQKFEAWKETFMAILLQWYMRYQVHGLVEPDLVTEYTKEYQRKNDVFADFCDNYVRKEEGSFVNVTTLFQIFREYCRDDNIRTSKNIKKADFQEALERRYGSTINAGGRQGVGWKGLGVVTPAKNEQKEEQEQEEC